MTYGEKKEGLITLCYYGVLLALGFLFFKYCFTTCLPFLVGALVASLIKPLVALLANRSRLPYKVLSFFVVSVFYLAVILVLLFFGTALFGQLKTFFDHIPALFSNVVFPALYQFIYNLEKSVFANFPLLKQLDFSTLFDSVQRFVGELSTGGIKFITDMVMGLPPFIMGVFFAIVSTFLISGDYLHIGQFLRDILPQKQFLWVAQVQRGALQSVKIFITSQFQLMVVTFSLLGVGLALLGVESPLFTAAVISLVDFLPILGTGVVLMPWIIIESVMGNFSLSIGLLAVFITVALVRNLLEPKIMGAQTGFSPLITLMAIYFGGKLFGVFGIFLAPMLLNIGREIVSGKKVLTN